MLRVMLRTLEREGEERIEKKGERESVRITRKRLGIEYGKRQKQKTQ